jgi:hypothetical protein
MGWGGITAVAQATGLSRPTIQAGLAELKTSPNSLSNATPAKGRIRRPGGGRHCLKETDPTLLQNLEALVEPTTCGDPQSPLRWTCKSTRNLAQALGSQGHRPGRLGGLLPQGSHRSGLALQGIRLVMSGSRHGTAHRVDRDRSRKRVTLQEAIEPVPRHPAATPTA